MEESITYAKKYLEDILSFFGLNTDIHATHDEDVIELSVPSSHMNGFLIGQRGDTLRAIQFLISTALRNSEHEFTRVNVDVADYKKNRADRLAHRVEDWIRDVKADKKPMHLRPMNAVDRRTVHRVIGEVGGISSESEGEGRDRHIVLTPVDLGEEPEEVEPEKAEPTPEETTDTEVVAEADSEEAADDKSSTDEATDDKAEETLEEESSSDEATDDKPDSE